MYKFDWDENKNLQNKTKHGISFEEATEAFYDNDSLLIYDEMHSQNEDRYYQIGMIKEIKIVIVVFCIRVNDKIRIISARETTRKEREEYEKRKLSNTIC